MRVKTIEVLSKLISDIDDIILKNEVSKEEIQSLKELRVKVELVLNHK